MKWEKMLTVNNSIRIMLSKYCVLNVWLEIGVPVSLWI